MFGQLPKLFDRSFFIGFVLPASLLFSGVFGTLIAFNYIKADIIANKSTFDAALSVVIIWLIAILLTALNRPFIRLLEGYGDYNPFKVSLRRKKQEFKNRILPIFTKFDQIIRARRTRGIEPEREPDFATKLWNAANEYPERTDFVLSTNLGNVMRAYERYSGVVYEMESIVLWPRLFMVIPEEARNRVREGEALFQFSINTLIAGVACLAFYLIVAAISLYSGSASGLLDAVRWPGIPIISALSAWFGWWQLPGAARQRGEQIKAVFDLYRGALAEALGLEVPATHKAEREMWRLVSRRMLRRVSEDDKSLDDFRKKGDTQSSDKKSKAREPAQQNEIAEIKDHTKTLMGEGSGGGDDAAAHTAPTKNIRFQQAASLNLKRTPHPGFRAANDPEVGEIRTLPATTTEGASPPPNPPPSRAHQGGGFYDVP